jgi:integrase
MGTGFHGGQHRHRGRRDRALGACACRAREVNPMPHVPEVHRLVAHRREDAAAKRPIAGRMRHPQRLRHVALGQPMLARVIGHPPDAKGELGGGAEQRPSNRVGIPATKAVQHHLGHKSASITLDRYGHLFPEELDHLADRLDRLHAQAAVYPACTDASVTPLEERKEAGQ